MKGYCFVSCWLALMVALSEEQKPSEATFGAMVSKAKFGQSRPFNHFGRRRQPSPIIPSVKPLTTQPSKMEVPIADKLPGLSAQGTQSQSRFANNATRTSAGSGASASLGLKPLAPSVSSSSQKAVAGSSDALRSVEAGSFVVGSNENFVDKVFETKLGNKINMESKVSSLFSAITQVETVRVGETAILHCTFEEQPQTGGSLLAQIWWTKLPTKSQEKAVVLASGSLVRLPDERMKVISFPEGFFSVLIIRNAVEEDAAEYKCSLPTVTGYKTTFSRLEVKETMASQIETSETTNLVRSGDNQQLFCKSKKGVPLSVWWTAKAADGKTINVIDAEDKVFGETLLLTSLTKEMEGIYSCHIENREGNPFRKNFSVILKEKPWQVLAYRQGFKSDAQLAKAGREVVHGEAVDLRCDSGGVPKPVITWLKHGRVLHDIGGNYGVSAYDSSYKPNAVVSKLTIRAFAPSDAARYTCAVENEIGYREHHFDLRVLPLTSNEILETQDNLINY